jgi:hypothetical protein
MAARAAAGLIGVGAAGSACLAPVAGVDGGGGSSGAVSGDDARLSLVLVGISRVPDSGWNAWESAEARLYVPGEGTVLTLPLVYTSFEEPIEPSCPEDLDRDGDVDSIDLLRVLAAMGGGGCD